VLPWLAIEALQQKLLPSPWTTFPSN